MNKLTGHLMSRPASPAFCYTGRLQKTPLSTGQGDWMAISKHGAGIRFSEFTSSGVNSSPNQHRHQYRPHRCHTLTLAQIAVSIETHTHTHACGVSGGLNSKLPIRLRLTPVYIRPSLCTLSSWATPLFLTANDCSVACCRGEPWSPHSR